MEILGRTDNSQRSIGSAGFQRAPAAGACTVATNSSTTHGTSPRSLGAAIPSKPPVQLRQPNRLEPNGVAAARVRQVWRTDLELAKQTNISLHDIAKVAAATTAAVLHHLPPAQMNMALDQLPQKSVP